MAGQGLGMHLALAMHVNLALNRDAMGVRVEQRREALQKRKKKQDKKAAATISHGADIKLSLNHKQLISSRKNQLNRKRREISHRNSDFRGYLSLPLVPGIDGRFHGFARKMRREKLDEIVFVGA